MLVFELGEMLLPQVFCQGTIFFLNVLFFLILQHLVHYMKLAIFKVLRTAIREEKITLN